ncbi:MAG: shikimate dehydrogenase [Actinobacteria bacterium]|nr:shikimate dehydrogenase [Actinomycetota bacterium]
MKQLAAVIGSPVRHSLSPAIHNAAFAHHGDAWVYVAFEVQPAHAAAAVDAMRVLGIAGLSVTMPHKEMVLGALDELSDDARLVGAANTVVRDASGRLVGHNTDGAGCVDALQRAGADLGSVAVIGAGATARAVVAALARTGTTIGVANRTAQRRAEAVRLGNTVRSGSTSEINTNDIARFPTIINTTPVGMHGVHPSESAAAIPVEVAMLRAGQFVLDAVYHPLETALLRAVRDRGGVAIDGLEMLCAQAARQQELWLGRRPDVALMRAAALGELAKSQQ